MQASVTELDNRKEKNEKQASPGACCSLSVSTDPRGYLERRWAYQTDPQGPRSMLHRMPDYPGQRRNQCEASWGTEAQNKKKWKKR